MYDLKNPIRVQIANHGNHSQNVEGFTRGDLWIVAPRENPSRDEPSYYIEIDNSYPRIDGKSYSRIVKVAYIDGDRTIWRDDAYFDANMDDVIEHEIFVPAGMSYRDAMCSAQFDEDGGEVKGVRALTRDEAIEHLNERHIYAFRQAREFEGVQIGIFTALERAWEALNEFADFSITI